MSKEGIRRANGGSNAYKMRQFHIPRSACIAVREFRGSVSSSLYSLEQLSVTAQSGTV